MLVMGCLFEKMRARILYVCCIIFLLKLKKGKKQLEKGDIRSYYPR